MCQISAVLERDGSRETIMEGVTGLEVTGEGVLLTTFFEDPKLVPDVAVARIDFLGGSVVMVPREQPQGE
ncbi:CooT family nickel-binding protein [Desulfolithobacter sp.]